MKKEVYLGQNSFRFLYYRYKDSPYYFLFFIIILFLVCSFLIFRIILPQFDSWISIRNEVEATENKINILRANINYMNSLDKGVIDEQLKVAAAALPVDKDFGVILIALNGASLKAGVSLDDYTFQLGNITDDPKPSNNSNTALNTAPQGTAGQEGLFSIRLSVVINGSVEGLRRFLQEIHKQLPLVEVVSVDGSGDAMTVNLQFYQKSFPNLILNDEESIPRISPDNEALLMKLSDWRKAIPPSESALQEGSASANLPLF